MSPAERTKIELPGLTGQEIFYDNSMLEVFRRCHRQYYLTHVRHWKPEKTAHDLIFGLSWHAAMDVVWALANGPEDDATVIAQAMQEFLKTWREYYPEFENQSLLGPAAEDEFYPKTPGRAMEMLSWYLKKRRHIIAKYEVLAIELPFIVPLSETGGEIYYIGRLDKVYKDIDRRVYIVDHKTTKSPKGQWQATFWPNNQMSGYMYNGVLAYGPDFAGINIDGALCQKGSARERFEPDLPPGIGFPQVPLLASTAETEAWLWETNYTILLLQSHLDMLKECKPNDRFLRAFDKRTTACGYYSGCIYRSICAYIPNPAALEEPPAGFKKEEWRPFDIVMSEKPFDGNMGGE